MSQTFSTFRIEHVYREQNKEADALANEAMDEVSGARPVPAENSKMENGKAKMESRTVAAAIKVRARFRSGILYPLEDVNLPDGAEVEILVRPASKS
jgi:hypothetical protein